MSPAQIDLHPGMVDHIGSIAPQGYLFEDERVQKSQTCAFFSLLRFFVGCSVPNRVLLPLHGSGVTVGHCPDFAVNGKVFCGKASDSRQESAHCDYHPSAWVVWAVSLISFIAGSLPYCNQICRRVLASVVASSHHVERAFAHTTRGGGEVA